MNTPRDQLARPAGTAHPAVVRGTALPSPGMSDTAVVWFRRDLRVRDQPTFLAAADAAPRSLALYVLDPALFGPSGAARRALLDRSLRDLDAAFGGKRPVPAPRLRGRTTTGRSTPFCSRPARRRTRSSSLARGPHRLPFRVFNPITQGEVRPDGHYVRAFVPELSGVPGKAVHRPWALPGGIPDGIPEPMVDHKAERLEALARYERVTSTRLQRAADRSV